MSALFDTLIRGSIKHRHLVLLAAVALTGFCLASVPSAHLDALPTFTPPLVIVQAEAPGFGTSAVEQLVTTPLEQGLLGTPDVTAVRSTSSPGLCAIQMTFEDGTDIFRARQLVGERLAETASRLPAELPAPRLSPITASVGALLKLAYTAPPGDEEALRALWRFAHWTVRPRLQAIEGIARVTVHGGAAARIEVRPRPEAMLARGISLSQLEATLARAQSVSALGHVSTGAQQAAIRANGLWVFGDLEPIGNVVIETRDRLPVRVTDIADVVLGEAPAVGSALYDGQPAIYLQIDKLPWADTPRVTALVEEALTRLDASLPDGTERRAAVFRQADFVRTSLVAVGRAMALGAVFVIVVLVLFLRSKRLSAISLTALPLSIVAAAAVLLWGGVTINGMILGGLAIAVGEVVDDAIVDVENIWRRLRRNAESDSPRPPLDVIQEASSEVRGAVVYASGIVLVVLLPIVLLGGMAGRIFSPLAETYALAIAASLLIALTVTPALSAFFMPALLKKPASEPTLTRWLRRTYDRTLLRVQRQPGRVVAVSATLGAAAMAVAPFLGGGFLPEFREGVLIAEVATWPGTSLEETTRLAGRISSRLLEEAHLPHVAVRIGRASLDEDSAPAHRMEIDLVLPPDAGDPEEVAARVMERMGEVPGIRFSVEGFLGERINELLSGERAPIVVKLVGPELETLRASARRLMAEMEKLDDLFAVRSASLVDVPTLDLGIDERRLAVAGVSRREVVDAVAAWRQGLEVSQIKAPKGYSVPLVVAGSGQFRDRESLPELPIFSAASAVLPVSSIVDLSEGSEPPQIVHEGGRRVVTLTARAEAANLSRAASEVEALAARLLGQSVDWRLAGQATERRAAGLRLAVTALMVLVGVFAFLWMAFGSAVDAAVVLGGLPFGMVGGVGAALLLPEGLSMAGFVGFVALAGILSRNGIMLVAHKNRLLSLESDESTEERLLRAARERVLPIVMTAATTFFGLLPLAASLASAGSELEAPMAVIVCCGLVSSTAFNLVAVPAFFLWRERRWGRQESRA